MASVITFPVGLVFQKVGPGAVLAAPLFFPELSRLGTNHGQAQAAVERNLIEMITRMPKSELIHRRRAVAASQRSFTLTLDPPRHNTAWREPLTLTFHAIVWEHPAIEGRAASALLAHIAELGIEVLAESEAQLSELLRKESLAALRRRDASSGLQPLASFQATNTFRLAWVDVPVPIPSLKERAVNAETETGDAKRTVLQKVASLLKAKKLEPAFEVEDAVQQIAEALTAKPPQSVLLIGPSGVGKTAVVREVVRRACDFALGATPFYQTSGARIVAGQTGFGMWEERCQELIKDATRKRAILHLGPLVELMEVGKSEHNHSGIATFLRPALARGELLGIAECTPEQLPLLEKQDPQLLDVFRHVNVEEPDTIRGRAILKRFAEGQRRRSLEVEALGALDRLHRRYATYSAYPGRPLRFLENLLRDGPRRTPITEDEIHHGFTRETGLPRSLIDPAVALDLAETHRWFSGRVIGQSGAVDLVVDLLATIKAGLTRPNRPIASLLFIGPTGVGKTEMAKALAEFLFGSRERLTRFDMSEFADPVSVRRLIGGAFGSEGLLTARVREQPFSVLLLDEVEKADGSFFDLLLQALGEARLTDAGGRLADFRNTVVILTSNLGAESYRTGSTGFAGAALTSAEAQEHFTRAVEQFLRPEMFNRLDRVVPFAPLSSDVVRSIADREWHKVRQRDGIRFRGIQVNTDPALLDHLAAIGFDPRYGARPLKRAIERETIAPLARQFNRFTSDTALSVEVGTADGKPHVSVKPVQGAKPRSAREPNDAVGTFTLAVQQLRRWHQLLESSSTMRELNNEITQLEHLERLILRRQARGKVTGSQGYAEFAKLGRLRELAAEVNRVQQTAFAIEDESIIAFHEGMEQPLSELTERYAAANADWDHLLLRLYALRAPKHDSTSLVLFSEHREHLAALAAAYQEVSAKINLSVRMVRFVLPGTEPPPEKPFTSPDLIREMVQGRIEPRRLEDETAEVHVPETAWLQGRLYRLTETTPKELLWRLDLPADHLSTELPPGTIGVGLEIAGAGSYIRFGGEAGLHKFDDPESTDPANPDVFIVVCPGVLTEYKPSERFLRKGAIEDDVTRRWFELEQGRITDAHVEHTWTNLRGELAAWLEPVIAANMRLRLIRLVVE